MDVLKLTIYAVWFISEILINRLTKSKNKSKDDTDKNSLLLIWVVIVVSITAAVFVEMNYPFPFSANGVVVYVGLFAILCGIILRTIIIKSLGAFFTADVAIIENHSLKTDGFYKFLRHPTYFASLLSFVGFGLSLNNWISFAIIMVSILFAFIYRIKVEEIALIDHFGTRYSDYKKSTKGLIPFVY